MKFEISLTSATLILIGIGIVQFLLAQWTKSRIDNSIKSEYAKILEDYKFDMRAREQATRVAEYLALARQLKEDSPESDFIRANQLSWELEMWLPDEVYKKTTLAIAQPSKDINELEAVISVRKLLLGKKKCGNLTQDDIAHHAPGIGKNSEKIE